MMRSSQDNEKVPLISASIASYESFNSSNCKRPSSLKVKEKGLFSYTTCLDYCLILMGTFAGIAHGTGFPLLSIVLGGMTTIFLRAENSDFVRGYSVIVNNSALSQITKEEFDASVTTYCLYYLLIGVFMFISSYIQIACWESFSERTTHRIRQKYLKAILRQQIAWFDTQQSGNLTARLTDDLERVREGLGDKLSMMIQLMAAFIAGFIVGFIYNWRMTLVMMAFAPLNALTGAWMSRMAATRTQVEQEKYAVAGAIAEETFSSIRTVHSLNGATREIARYEKALEDGRRTGRLKYLYLGTGMALNYLIVYASYAVAFWYGSLIIIGDPTFDRGSVFTVFFSVMSGSMALGGALPNMATFAMARGAARKVLSVINSVPIIDPYSSSGTFPSKLKGAISFQNVSFSYPIRKDIQILDRITFDISPGRKIALVGSSGCGKSTVMHLLLRFYDPDLGMVTLDGYDIRSLNVRRLRDAIGIVSQEPILFDGTIESNIRLGWEKATREDIVRACKQANAWEFIQLLPDGLSTRVGERGVQLSGGQKQRIAIARALIKDPQILLLDEATSALDTESESVVQKALEQAQIGRTTITIAHRLSTIRDVDEILVFKNGSIVERGTHIELIAARGLYYGMVLAQDINQQTEMIDDEMDEVDDVDDRSSNLDVVRKKRSIANSYHRSVSDPSELSLRSSAAIVKELQDAAEESSVRPTPMSRIFLMNRETWPYLFVGLVGCCLSGIVPPFFALVYSQIFSVFSEPVDRLGSDARFWSLMFLACGVIDAIGFFISANMLGLCGETLTKKIRLMAFTNLLRQDIAFYDDQRHSTGKLCTRFATDAPNVRYVFTRLPLVVASVVTLVGAIAIGFLFGWQLALILLAIVPLILGSGYVEMRLQFGKQLRETELLEEAGRTATEAVENIRTVQSLNKQSAFIREYSQHLETPFRENMQRAHIYGAVFAFSQSLIFFMYALAFWLGSLFVDNAVMQPINVYRVFFAIAFCGQSVGHISAFIPDVVKARLAASLVFHLSEYPTAIDSLSDQGSRITIKGAIQLKNVFFSYPTRRNTRILRGLTLNVKEGETVALVGHSGCGKSTVMGLLERFYDPNRGNIYVDGENIRDVNIKCLRSQMCIVSQEPILFDCTIEENIMYGLDREVSHEEVVNAAKLANIHKFILSLPLGYETRVGEKGTQLSGGQKQRIAIARALIRNPSILLLDEATSALDTESEQVVQEALENARKGRTCLVIAHRLSTIQNSNLIVVINEGKVAEKGTHAQLLEASGIYKTLCETQTLVAAS
uniref:ABC-type xenobiotic transporter n=1 Tax=Parascaris univalens TaxID=6257 RepID=A0A7H9SKD8_PARUN|nr:P-glycoprotein 2 [Parascaris univalens]